MLFSSILAGGTSVVVMDVSTVHIAIVVVVKFPRGSGCGGSSIASTMVAVAIVMRLPRLEVNGLLDNVCKCCSSKPL